MRSRFFFIIFAVLSIVTIGSIVLFSVYLSIDRFAALDQSARVMAVALIDSDLGDLRHLKFSGAEKMVSEELGEQRLGKFFIIRNDAGDIIYQSPGANLVNVPLMSHAEKWMSLRANGQFIRILNLELPKIHDRFLQVGVVVDEDVLYPHYFSFLSFQFAAVVLVIGMTASFLLTSFLLRPLVNLEQYLSVVADQANSRSQLDTVPGSLLAGHRKSRDEFRTMVQGLNALIERVNRAYRSSRLWAYQMAHELKTPLAIQNLEIEKLQKKYGASADDIAPLLSEGEKISSTIDSFLDWAEVENTSARKSLFAVRLGAIGRSICARLEGAFPGRIQLDIQSDPVVVANPSHIEQMISNLLTNALIYTRGAVTLMISDNAMAIVDQGKGIPREVLDRLGEPFNRGSATPGEGKGNGLGLAWVNSICRQYKWNLSVEPFATGSRVVIKFPLGSEADLTHDLS